jgi:type I restriction enzyme, S subunit
MYFKEIFEFKPKSKSQASVGLNKGTYKFFTSSPIQSKFINEFLYEKDSLIFGTGGSPSVHFCNNKFSTTTDCFVVQPIIKNIKTKFVYYFFIKNFQILEKGFKGAGLKHISKEYIGNIQIPLPSLEEQKQISEILDKANALRQKRKQSIQLLDDYLKTLFYDMFGDLEKNLKMFKTFVLNAVCSEIVDCPHSTPIKSSVPTEYACIRTSELNNGYIYWDSMQYVNKIEYDKRVERLTPIEGDIVYGREGTFGDAVMLPSHPKFCLGQRTMLFRPNNNICNSVFLWYEIISDYFYRQAQRKNTGSTVGHINVQDIKKFKLLIPPISLQNQFARIVVQVEQTKSKMEESLKEIDNLFNSLINKYFRK